MQTVPHVSGRMSKIQDERFFGLLEPIVLLFSETVPKPCNYIKLWRHIVLRDIHLQARTHEQARRLFWKLIDQFRSQWTYCKNMA